MSTRTTPPELGRFTTRDPALLRGGQANLYAYADADPLTFVDRTGLASAEVGVGAGLYLGVKAAITADGFSFCWEAGVGIGVGVELDPFEGLDADGTSVVAEVGVEIAGLGVSGKAVRDLQGGPCGDGGSRAEVKACGTVVCGKVNQDGDFGVNASLANADLGTGAAAKATIQHCRGGLW